MNQPTDDPWESAMSREFDARVRDLHEAPLTVDQVRHKARTIRRNRRLAAAGGVLAVVAVVAPIAVLTDGNGRPAGEVDPAGSPRTTTQTLPEVERVTGDGWHRADGSVVPLRGSYGGGVVWDNHLVAPRHDAPGATGSTVVVDVIDADGDVVDTFTTNGERLVVNQERTTLAYVTPDGRLVTRWDDDSAVIRDGLRRTASVGAIRGGPDCGPDSGCIVYLNAGESTGCQVVTGIKLQPSSVDCHDAHDDLLTVTTTATGCSGLRETEQGGGYRWQTCDWAVSDFSPDGRYVAAIPRGSTGDRHSQVVILDASGAEARVVASYDDRTVMDWAWLPDGAGLALTTLTDGGKQIVVLGPDGSTVTLDDGARLALVH